MAIIHILGSSIFFYVLLLFFPITSSISESEALLKLKESFTNATSLESWKPGTEPCTKDNPWIGVICYHGSVISLRLGNLGLSGNIDVDALASLPGLRSIVFVANAFTGPIPNLGRMSALKGLYLSWNQFSGEIPPGYFTTMVALKKVWLSGNRFSGPIPSSLAQLSHLMDLHLENNQFSGTIPPLGQRSLVSLNLSNNNLEGEIPPVMANFSAKAFKGNPGLCGGSLGRPCDSLLVEVVEDDIPYKKIVTWVLISAALLFLLMVVGIYMLKRRQDNFDMMVDNSLSFSSSSRGKMDFDSGRDGLGSSHRAPSSRKGSSKYGKGVGDIVMINYEKGEFGLPDLMKAAAEILGNGILGSSYKAVMANGFTVVVKRIKETPKMGKDQFDFEMRKLGSLKHKNVLTPLAYHYRKDEKLLVYEYQPKGSLVYLLHGDRGVSHAKLNWSVRLRIIQGIARGLGYLHTELSALDLPHGDLKSSNVLLTPEFEPLLTDYGLCTLISSNQAAQALAAYKSPEAILQDEVSPKSDVFCLGVVILEIVTGKFPSQYLNNVEGGIDIVQWVKSAIVEGREVDVFDPNITSSTNSTDEMEKLLHIGVACTETDPQQRLDLREAIKRIEGVSIGGSSKDMKTSHLLMPSSSGDGYADKLPAAL